MSVSILRKSAVAVLVCLLGSTVAHAVPYTTTKSPDVGPFWQPLGNDSGTDVYSNSFVAADNGAPTTLGMWLMESTAGVPNLRFEIWGDNSGPDAGAVLMSTGSIDLSGSITTSLAFYSAPVATIIEPLQKGETYWFVATAVGETAAPGNYQVGGHTQNSACADDGTFWYSNDPAGINFDGQSQTPEMAFEVQVDGGGAQRCGGQEEPLPVPTLSPLALLLLSLMMGLGGAAVVRSRMV